MLSSEQMQALYNLSDAVLYPEAVAFMRRLVYDEECMPLPASQITGLLNIANASSYTELDLFIKHQRDRNWPESRKDIKKFYIELEKLFSIMKNKRLRDEFHLILEKQSSKESKQEIDELMAFLAHDFIQHLIAENTLLAVEKVAQRTKRGRSV